MLAMTPTDLKNITTNYNIHANSCAKYIVCFVICLDAIDGARWAVCWRSCLARVVGSIPGLLFSISGIDFDARQRIENIFEPNFI